MVKVKICGITNPEDAFRIARLKPDAMGFIFYKKSPRYIAPDRAKIIIKLTPKSIKKAGVFVNEKAERIKKVAGSLRLDMLQFHGEETPAFCAKFKNYKVIKALRIRNKGSFRNLKSYPAWAFLLDTYEKNVSGGTGKSFNWQLIKKAKLPRKTIFLSGGLNSRNVSTAVKLIRPDWVDVSSSVEIKPGKKDYKKVKAFIKAVRR